MKQNSHLDIKMADFNNKTIINQIRCHGIFSNKEKVLEGMKAIQRLLRIVPQEKASLIWTLLDAGFSSALEIASMSRTAFVKKITSVSGVDETTAKEIHSVATAKRSQLLPHIMNDIQNREPHIQSASF